MDMNFEVGRVLSTNEPFCLSIESVVAGRTFLASITRGGKSWLGRKIVEDCFGHAGIIIIDPEGEYSSLLEKFAFLIIGRDIPLQLETAEFMAEEILKSKTSVIIDLSMVEDDEFGKEYVNKFLRRFFFLETTARQPYVVFVEEAEDFVPEKGIATETCLHALVNIVKKGAKRGLGAIFIAHRPAWVSKGILAQCANKAIGKVEATDFKALEKYARVSSETIERLPSLSPGEFCFTGDWVKGSTFVKIGQVQTTHLGYTPKVPPSSPAELQGFIASLQRALPDVIEKIKPTVVPIEKMKEELRAELESKYKARIEAIQRTANEKAERRFKAEMDNLRELNDKLSRSQALQPTAAITDVLEHPIVRTRMSELSDKGRDLLVKVEREQGQTRQQLAAFLTTSTDSVANLITTINRVFMVEVIVGEGKPIKYRSMLKRLFITDVAKREIEELTRLQGELGHQKLANETLQGQNEILKKVNVDANQKLREVVPALEKLQKTSLQQATEIERLKREYQELALMSKAGMALSAGIKEIVDNRLKEIHPASTATAAGPVDEKRIVDIVKQQTEPFLLQMQKLEGRLASGVTSQSPGGIAVTLERKITHFDLQKVQGHLKVDTDSLQGRILTLVLEGFFEERHNRKQIVVELSNHGWVHEDKEVDAALLELCSQGVFHRKISTGSMLWYTLQPEAKELIHVEQGV